MSKVEFNDAIKVSKYIKDKLNEDETITTERALAGLIMALMTTWVYAVGPGSISKKELLEHCSKAFDAIEHAHEKAGF